MTNFAISVCLAAAVIIAPDTAGAATTHRLGADGIVSQLDGFLDVTQPPFNVDNSGKTDVTVPLQKAITPVICATHSQLSF